MTPGDALILEDELPGSLAWSGRPGAEALASLPGCAAVFMFIDEGGRPVQLMTAQQLNRTVRAKLSEPAETRRGKADLAEVVRGVRWRRVYSPFEARWRHYRVIRWLHPRTYRREMGFGPAWYLAVDWSAPIPELQVTERIWIQEGEFIGPWPTRKTCRQALETLWDLFELCRFPEQVRKAPHGTPCAYAEMKRCDAPCDGSASIAEYARRCRAAWRFAAGEIDEWEVEAQRRMKEAAQARRFEHAGLIKRQLEAASNWRTHWGGQIRPEARMNCLLLIPATRRKAWKPYLFRQGYLADGALLPENKVRSLLPIWLSEQRGMSDDRAAGGRREGMPAADDETRMEQTWLVADFMRRREARRAAMTYWEEEGEMLKRLDAIEQGLLTLREMPKEDGDEEAWTAQSSESYPWDCRDAT